MARTLLETLPDAQRIAVLLRADGWDNRDVASFLGVSERSVRGYLESALAAFPDLLGDHGRGKLYTLAYLIGLQAGGVEVEELPAWRDSLSERAKWLRSRSRLSRTDDAAAD